MKTDEVDDLRIVMQAAHWRQCLPDAGTRERRAFVDWLLESRRHVRNYLLLAAFETELTQVDPQQRHDVEALLAESGSTPIQLPRAFTRNAGKTPELGRRRREPWGAIAAAAVIAMLTIALSVTFATRAPTYSTSVGEQRAIPLADGTVIQLNTRSRVQIEFTARARQVRLLEGEALFTVRSDPIRPFRVDSGDGVIQALGTQFNVYRTAGGTVVSVIDGAVRLDPSGTRLDAGGQARLLGGKKIIQAAAPDISRAVAWRDRQLVFRDDRLEDIAAQFNRYNRTRQIHVRGAAARERRVTGIFAADDPQLLVRFLEQDKSLAVERDDHHILIGVRQ